MKTIDVAGRYPVYVGSNILEKAVDAIPEAATRVLVIHQNAVAKTAQTVVKAAEARELEVITYAVPDGEAAKTVEVAAALWSLLAQHGFTRTDIIIGVGGGAVTDLGGWIAASFLRGVAFIGVPTTVLAMVDAAVGGKTGINIPEGKNLVGAFHEPRAVIADLATLRDLPRADVAAGLAEVIKCGFIRDPKILDLIEAGPEAALDVTSPVLAELVERAIAVKADVVAQDLKESSLREILNYGHTFGHAIEQRENYTWRHGDAVAVGCVFAAELACVAGVLSQDVVERTRSIFVSVGLPVRYEDGDFADMLTVMGRDKKTRGNTLRFVVLHDVADVHRLVGPNEQQLKTAYDAVAG